MSEGPGGLNENISAWKLSTSLTWVKPGSVAQAPAAVAGEAVPAAPGSSQALGSSACLLQGDSASPAHTWDPPARRAPAAPGPGRLRNLPSEKGEPFQSCPGFHTATRGTGECSLAAPIFLCIAQIHKSDAKDLGEIDANKN